MLLDYPGARSRPVAPVYSVDSLDEGGRFECTATEFLFRQMTDQQHPFHTAVEQVRGHWFQEGVPLKS